MRFTFASFLRLSSSGMESTYDPGVIKPEKLDILSTNPSSLLHLHAWRCQKQNFGGPIRERALSVFAGWDFIVVDLVHCCWPTSSTCQESALQKVSVLLQSLTKKKITIVHTLAGPSQLANVNIQMEMLSLLLPTLPMSQEAQLLNWALLHANWLKRNCRRTMKYSRFCLHSMPIAAGRASYYLITLWTRIVLGSTTKSLFKTTLDSFLELSRQSRSKHTTSWQL